MKRSGLLLLLFLASPAIGQESSPDAQYAVFMGETGVIVLTFQIQTGGMSPQQSFLRYADGLMTSFDANGDGVVTLAEARGKYLSARDALEAQLVPRSEVVAPDTTPDVSPADGKITRTELISYFKRIGIQPFLLLYQPGNAPVVANRQPRQSATTPDIPLFSRLDGNRDGKLSAEELTGALRTLRKLDLDDDETISAAELTPVSNQFAGQQIAQDGARAAAMSPFLSTGADESISKQVRRLIEKYDSNDPAKSGVEGVGVRNQKLSQRELGVSAEVLGRYDGDGDGQLDFDELRQFLTSPEPAVTLTMNLETGEPLKSESTRDDLREKLRTTPDGAANINLGTIQLTIVRGAIANAGTAEAFLKPQFMAADADANGYLEKPEAERAYLFGATFENLDTDKNGKVFLDEAIAFFQIRFDAARSRTVLNISEQGRTLFEILDTDRDRRLSFRELQAAADKLALWDKDGDGLLAESEVPLQYRLTIARGNLPALGGNFIDVRMNSSGTPSERTAGPLWYRKMDKNRDGEVSRREFLGETATFEKLDSNHDGFLDVNEAVQPVVE
jgi:Ca2+-binding EF-hand superfamily protein